MLQHCKPQQQCDEQQQKQQHSKTNHTHVCVRAILHVASIWKRSSPHIRNNLHGRRLSLPADVALTPCPVRIYSVCLCVWVCGYPNIVKASSFLCACRGCFFNQNNERFHCEHKLTACRFSSFRCGVSSGQQAASLHNHTATNLLMSTMTEKVFAAVAVAALLVCCIIVVESTSESHRQQRASQPGDNGELVFVHVVSRL